MAPNNTFKKIMPPDKNTLCIFRADCAPAEACPNCLETLLFCVLFVNCPQCAFPVPAQKGRVVGTRSALCLLPPSTEESLSCCQGMRGAASSKASASAAISLTSAQGQHSSSLLLLSWKKHNTGIARENYAVANESTSAVLGCSQLRNCREEA